MAVPPPRVPPTQAPSAKSLLRSELRRAREAFVGTADAETLDTRQATLIAYLLPLLIEAGPISGYVAHRGEPDISALLRRVHEAGIVVALPHVGPDRRMHFAAWHPEAVLSAGAFGIPQPAAIGEEIVPAIVLTPLVGFDRAGHRLGMGAGHYDRWFAAHPRAKRIGIAWSVQEVPSLPHDDWDVPLHAIATDNEWIVP